MNIASKATDNRIRIGIWGPRASGKTTYLVTLFHECLISNDWDIAPLDKSTVKFISDNHRLIHLKGLFPPSTDAGQTSYYQFQLSRRRQGIFKSTRQQTVSLGFLDPSGEWYENTEDARSKYPIEIDPYAFLAQSSALLFLIDPKPDFLQYAEQGEGENHSYFELLIQTIYDIKDLQLADQPSPQYLAIAFTKMEQPNRWERRTRLQDYAREVLGEHTIRVIETAFPAQYYKFFAVSAVGMLEDGRPNVETISDEQRQDRAHIISPARLKPLSIFEPIEWLLSKLVKDKE
ncbi:MAG: TRAFAC clade GTPase domain-containing protein [Caldilinea sp.]|jgi:hypothetical protein